MEYLTLTNSTEIIRIASEDIVFIKGDGNYSDIYLSNGKAENVSSNFLVKGVFLTSFYLKISCNPHTTHVSCRRYSCHGHPASGT